MFDFENWTCGSPYEDVIPIPSNLVCRKQNTQDGPVASDRIVAGNEVVQGRDRKTFNPYGLLDSISVAGC